MSKEYPSAYDWLMEHGPTPRTDIPTEHPRQGLGPRFTGADYDRSIPSTADQPIIENEEGGKGSRITGRYDLIPAEAIIRLAEVVAYGAEKYEPGNWERVEGWQHLNHTLAHLALYQLGDTSEDHLGHALCRLAFAVWAEKHRGDMNARKEGQPSEE